MTGGEWFSAKRMDFAYKDWSVLYLGVTDVAHHKLKCPRPADETFFQTADTSDRHPSDQELRRRGFKIVARPAAGGGEVLWERNGRKYTQAEAERYLLTAPKGAGDEDRPKKDGKYL